MSTARHERIGLKILFGLAVLFVFGLLDTALVPYMAVWFPASAMLAQIAAFILSGLVSLLLLAATWQYAGSMERR